MKKLLFIITILIVTTITIGNFNKQVADKERYKWDCVYWAISAVESEFNHLAIGSKGDGGVIQIMPKGSGGYLDEANRLLKEDKYTDKDRFCPVKSREIWEVVMRHRNPNKSLFKAIKLHNPKAGSLYLNKVIIKYEEFIKTIRQYENTKNNSC